MLPRLGLLAGRCWRLGAILDHLGDDRAACVIGPLAEALGGLLAEGGELLSSTQIWIGH
jgi:hypothetical protein